MPSSHQAAPTQPPGDVAESDITLSGLQHALGRVLRSLVFRGDPDSPLVELPVSQLKCLYVIAEREEQKMIDLAHRMEIKLPALSQIVDRLVKRGMVERHADPQDRRVVRMALTDQARTILADAERNRQARMSATVRHLSARALDEAVAGLQLLAEAAEKVEAEEKQSAPPFLLDADPQIEIISRRPQLRLRKDVPEVSPLPCKRRQ